MQGIQLFPELQCYQSPIPCSHLNNKTHSLVKMLTVTFLLVTLLVVILLDHFQRLKKFKWLNQFDGPSPILPIIGNSLQFLGHPSRYGDVFLSNLKDFGITHQFWQMTQPSLVTADPQLVEIILNSSEHLQKHICYASTAKFVMGNGLITSDVDQWKSDRKFLNPFFNLEFFRSSFNLCVNNWSTLENAIDASACKPVKCQKYFSEYFMKILLNSYSPNPSPLTEKDLCEMKDQLKIALDVMNVRISKPWTKIPIYWKLSGYERKLNKFHKDCAAIMSKVVGKSNNQKVIPCLNAFDPNTVTHSPRFVDA